MINTVDHLIIAVQDLNEAEQDYKKLFGIEPVWRGEHKELGTENVIFNFKNTYLELLSAKGEGLGAMLVNNTIQENGDGLIGVVFGVENIKEASKSLISEGFAITEVSDGEGRNNSSKELRKWKNFFLPQELTRGIFSFIIEHTEGSLKKIDEYPSDSINKLDHLVINTNDADGFIHIYQDIFKIRLALDKVIEHWDSRMLFFRLNKTTLEVIEKRDNKDPKDSLWGLAWEVENIKKAHKRLTNYGVEMTPIKSGLKENTLVATIKSHTHNVPTLLIEHIG
jgi:catechol 2,3-dioxygenase-like lactoylglutathione lyase family enzyme|tara:strand:+ start:1571 stop:2413 length:843 start_codon:yes stop_codon:yes gene_type:complete